MQTKILLLEKVSHHLTLRRNRERCFGIFYDQMRRLERKEVSPLDQTFSIINAPKWCTKSTTNTSKLNEAERQSLVTYVIHEISLNLISFETSISVGLAHFTASLHLALSLETCQKRALNRSQFSIGIRNPKRLKLE